MNQEDSGVSITTGFILNLGIAVIAMSVFFYLGQGVYTNVQDQTAGTEIRVIGQKIAQDLESADRLSEFSEGTIERDYPRIEHSYTVNVTHDNASGNGTLELSARGVEATIDFYAENDVAPGKFEFTDTTTLDINYGPGGIRVE